MSVTYCLDPTIKVNVLQSFIAVWYLQYKPKNFGGRFFEIVTQLVLMKKYSLVMNFYLFRWLKF